MRYRLAALMLFAVLSVMLFTVLPMMNVLAAPILNPWAILDIGPPPKGKTPEQHLKDQIEFKTSLDTLNDVCSDPEVKKLSSVASMKDARPWLATNLRVTPEDGGRRLRFKFRAGTRDEQVTILNAFLRDSLHWHDLDGMTLKRREEWLRWSENQILELERRIESGQQPHMVDTYREGINYLRYTRIPELRTDIARRKQYAVVKWAK
ncbi:MAG TPA: hypothetical protein VH575_18550 [Gemmataceae bacterium]